MDALHLAPAGDEWILRWRVVTSDGPRDLQARIKAGPDRESDEAPPS